MNEQNHLCPFDISTKSDDDLSLYYLQSLTLLCVMQSSGEIPRFEKLK